VKNQATVVVEGGIVLKAEGDGFLYYNKQAILESKNELLKEEILNIRGKCPSHIK
jgi:hypothetical protein